MVICIVNIYYIYSLELTYNYTVVSQYLWGIGSGAMFPHQGYQNPWMLKSHIKWCGTISPPYQGVSASTDTEDWLYS